MNRIIAFKLASGEEIIGKFNTEESTSEMIVLDDPVALVMMRTQEGMRGTFMSYVQSAPEIDKLSFPTKHMTCLPFDVVKEVADGYMQSMSKLDLSAASTQAGLTLVKP